jgi:hypothetical protein
MEPLLLPTESELPFSTPGLLLPFSNSDFIIFFIFSFLFVLLVCCGCVKGCSLLIEGTESCTSQISVQRLTLSRVRCPSQDGTQAPLQNNR